MIEAADNFSHEYFRRVDGKLDRVLEHLANQAARIGHVESAMAQITVQLGEINVRMAEHSVRFDRLDARLDRIERRIELTDA